MAGLQKLNAAEWRKGLFDASRRHKRANRKRRVQVQPEFTVTRIKRIRGADVLIAENKEFHRIRENREKAPSTR